jgi:hypothetical protein
MLGLCASAGFVVLYPFILAADVLIVIGGLESICAVLVYPAAQTVLSGSVEPGAQGRAQGLAGAIRTGAMAIGAYGGASLFGVGPNVPFDVAGAVLLASALGVGVLWAGVPHALRAGPQESTERRLPA